MKNFKYILFLITILFSLQTACNRAPEKEEEEIVLPNTPEEVTTTWVECYYKNEFDMAKRLSSPYYTLELVETLQKGFQLEPTPSEDIDLLNLRCKTLTDSTSVCFYTNQHGENDTIPLIKLSGQWLVNLPPDTMSFELKNMMEDEFN